LFLAKTLLQEGAFPDDTCAARQCSEQFPRCGDCFGQKQERPRNDIVLLVFVYFNIVFIESQ
jgi:hypothetical protein